MEDAPRNTSHDEDILPRPDTDQQENDTYMSLWRRFGLKRLDSGSRLRDAEKDEDEDEEEDDETPSSSTRTESYQNDKWIQKRFLRLRKKIRPFLPMLEPVEVSPNSRPANFTSAAIEVHSDTTEQAEEAEVIYDMYHQDQAKKEPVLVEIEQTQTTKDPESIQEILKRRTLNNEFVQNNNEPIAVIEASSKTNISRVQGESQKNSVHKDSTIDKYFEKRKQKKLINKMQEREHKELQKEQARLRDELEAKITQSEKQHIALKTSIEQESLKSKHQVETAIDSKYNNEKNRQVPLQYPEKIKVVEQTIPPQHDIRESMISESRKEIDRLAQFENMIKQVEASKNTKITNEFAFERRHEVMDEPQNTPNTKFVPLSLNDRKKMEASLKSIQHEHTIKSSSSLRRVVNEIKESPESKHAISSGALGAIVGVLIFLAIYAIN